MDRDTSLKWAPVFRGISIILILLTFASWLLPYFNYDADDFGIDTSKGPLRFVPQVADDQEYAVLSAPKYSAYEKANLVDELTGEYKITLLFDRSGLEEFDPEIMSYSEYLTTYVYDTDAKDFLKVAETSVDEATGDTVVTEKSLMFYTSQDVIPDSGSEDALAYEEYIKANVLVGTTPQSILKFSSTDIPRYNSNDDDSAKQAYVAANVIDTKTNMYKIPLRFLPDDLPLFQGEVGMTYGEYLKLYVFDAEANNGTGEFLVDMKVVNTLYRGNDTLKTLNGKNEVHDYPDKYSLWQFVLQAYNYPQILVQMNYHTALQDVEFYRPYIKLSAEETEGYTPEKIQEMLNNKAIGIQSSYHKRFYNEDGTPIEFRRIKIANMDQDLINIHPRFIKMWFIAPTLWQIAFGIVGLIMCWKKRGIMTQVFPFIFGIIGLIGYFGNRVLSYYSYPATYWIQIGMCVLVLANAIIGIIIQAMEIKSRPSDYYLPMV